jgi:hypothetical protein
MLTCPVTLAPCSRPSCRSGSCYRAAAPALLICWECGGLEAQGVTHGLCIACMRAYHAQDLHEEAE